MKTSTMLKVGFQKREDTYSSKLGFIIPADEITSNRNFTRWINNQIPVEDIKNVPRSGFVLNKNIKRNFSYSSSEKMRVFHPDGFEFEINMSNLSFILLNTNISAQEIMCDCVIGWFRGSVYLVPAHTEEGKDILKQITNTENLNLPSVGEIISIKNNDFIFIHNKGMDQLNFIDWKDKFIVSHYDGYVFYDITNKRIVRFKTLPEFTTKNTIVDVAEIENFIKQSKLLKKPKKLSLSSQDFAEIVFDTFNDLNCGNTQSQNKNLTSTIISLLSYLKVKKMSYLESVHVQTKAGGLIINENINIDKNMINTLVSTSNRDEFVKLFKSLVSFPSFVFYQILNQSVVFLKPVSKSLSIQSQDNIFDYQNPDKKFYNKEQKYLLSKV